MRPTLLAALLLLASCASSEPAAASRRASPRRFFESIDFARIASALVSARLPAPRRKELLDLEPPIDIYEVSDLLDDHDRFFPTLTTGELSRDELQQLVEHFTGENAWEKPASFEIHRAKIIAVTWQPVHRRIPIVLRELREQMAEWREARR